MAAAQSTVNRNHNYAAKQNIFKELTFYICWYI